MSDVGLFEVLAADQADARLASRKALVLAKTRLESTFGQFLAAKSGPEFDARYELIYNDFTDIVRSACSEVAHEDSAGVARTLHAHYRTAAKDIPEGKKDVPWQSEGESESEEEEVDEEERDNPTQEIDHKSKKSKWEKKAAKEAKKERKASLEKLARRPKMCPYHGEITDIALASGNPQAGYEVMQGQAWGDGHCQGSWDGGKCKFEPGMTTQAYWDERDQKLQDERARRQENGLDNVLDFPTEETTSPTDAPVGDTGDVLDFPDSGGGDLSVGEPVAEAPLAVAQSKVAAEPADKSDSYTQERKDLPTAEKDSTTGLGGPSPKIDKGNSRGDTNWSLDSIDPDSKRNPTERVDIQDYEKPGYLKGPVKDEIKGIGENLTETQDLPTAERNLDDSGFASNNMEMAPHTDQWGNDGQTEPVTGESLEKGSRRQRWAASMGEPFIPQEAPYVDPNQGAGGDVMPCENCGAPVRSFHGQGSRECPQCGHISVGANPLHQHQGI